MIARISTIRMIMEASEHELNCFTPLWGTLRCPRNKYKFKPSDIILIKLYGLVITGRLENRAVQSNAFDSYEAAPRITLRFMFPIWLARSITVNFTRSG